MAVNPSLHKCEDKRSSAISEALARGYTRKDAEKMVEETPLVSCLLPVEQVSWDQCKSFCDIGGFRCRQRRNGSTRVAQGATDLDTVRLTK